MPIVINHGFNAVAELGRQAGQAQGAAQAAEIERQSQQSIWNAFQKTADAFVHKKEIDDSRAFLASQQDKAFAHEDQTQQSSQGFAAAEQQRAFSHADTAQAVSQDFTAGQNKQHLDLAASQFDRTNAISQGHLDLARQGQAGIEADRTARRYTDLINADSEATQRTADAQLKQAQASKLAQDQQSKEQLQTFALQGLDREYTDPVTGEFKPDINYLVNKAHVLSGDFKAFTSNIQNLPSHAGKNYQSITPSENDLVSVAATQPKYAVQIAQATLQPKDAGLSLGGLAPGGAPGMPAGAPQPPSKEAASMLAAIAQVPYAPRFDPTRNPTYYQDLKTLEQGYRDNNAPEEMIAPIIQRVDELTTQREHFLLPRVQQQAYQAADAAVAADGPVAPAARNAARAKFLEAELQRNNIDVDEYEQWAERVAQAGSLFNLQRRDRMGEKRRTSSGSSPQTSR